MTIKEIAKIAKVSEGTVDRVIHNRGGVSKKTEERIRKIIKDSKFKINPIASALALKKKYNICALMPSYDEKNMFWKSPQMGMLKGVTEVETYGIKIQNYLFDQFNPFSYLKEFEKLLGNAPDAVIIAPMFITETKYVTAKLEELNIPYMFLNIDLEGFNNISFIGQDSFRSGYVAGKLMALCLNKDDSCATVQTRSNISNYHAIYKRIEGFNAYLNANSSNTVNHELVYDSFSKMNEVKQKLQSFLKADKKIKGIYVPSSRASFIAECLTEEQHKNISIIGFDTTDNNMDLMRKDKIQFLISQKSFNQGYEAIRTMSDFLIQKKVPNKKIFSPIQIIIKENLEYSNRNKLSFQHENGEGV